LLGMVEGAEDTVMLGSLEATVEGLLLAVTVGVSLGFDDGVEVAMVGI